MLVEPTLETAIALALILELPIDIVSVIVEWIRAGTNWKKNLQNLCIVHPVFVDLCQATLFESIELGPRLTTRFNDLMRGNPQLADNVRSVRYILPDHIRDEAEGVQALKKLKQVRSLHIQYGAAGDGINKALDWGDETVSYKRTWKYCQFLGTLSNMISRPTLETLTLTNIKMPADMISGATNLKTLYLHGLAQCGSFLQRAPPHGLKVRQLAVTGKAARKMAASFALDRVYPVTFSDVRTLQMALGRCDDEDKANNAILQWTRNLKNLMLSTDRGFDASFNRNVDPLRALHRKAFTSLTHLLVDIVFNITSSFNVINDPFQGLVCRNRTTDTALGKLSGLKSLKVRIWVRGPYWKNINVDANFAKPVWKNLDKALIPSDTACTNPQLKYVELIVGVEGDCHSAPQREVERFLPQIERCAVALAYLERVKRMESRGEIEGVLAVCARHLNCSNAECPYSQGL